MPGEVSERLERWVLRTFPKGSAERVLEVLRELGPPAVSESGPGREQQDWRDALLSGGLADEDWPERLDATL